MKFLKKIFLGVDPEKAAELIAQGVKKAQAGRHKQAHALYEEAEKRDPDNAIATLNLGIVKMDMFNARAGQLSPEEQAERLAEIFDTLERAVDKGPHLIAGHRMLGHVARRLSRYLRAEQAFENALALAEPDYPHSNEIQLALMQVTPHADRVRHVEKLVELADDDDATDEDVRAGLDLFVSMLPDHDPETPAEEREHSGIEPSRFLVAARLARRLDDDELAIDLLLRVLEEDAHNHVAKRELATLCMKRGESERALTFSLAAYKDDPTNAALVCNVGVCFLELGRLDDAREYIELARGLAPDNPIVQNAEAALEQLAAQPPPG